MRWSFFTLLEWPSRSRLRLSSLKSGDNRWLLAGFVAKPMIEADHDGLWYWQSARRYAGTGMNWDAWFYYQIAANLLNPLDSISSPNLQKLQQESNCGASQQSSRDQSGDAECA